MPVQQCQQQNLHRSGSDAQWLCWYSRVRKLRQLEDYRAFRDGRTGGAEIAGILCDPIPCYPNALVGAGLAPVDGHRKPATRAAE